MSPRPHSQTQGEQEQRMSRVCDKAWLISWPNIVTDSSEASRGDVFPVSLVRPTVHIREKVTHKINPYIHSRKYYDTVKIKIAFTG